MPAFFLSLQPNDARVQGRFISYVIKKSLPGAILMVLSVIIIEIFKISLGTFSVEVYTTMQVFVIFCSGVINLYHACKPLNSYRMILFFFSLIIISAIVVISIISGIPFLNFASMSPISEYWHHVLLIVSVILLDIPLSVILNKSIEKIKLPFVK